MSRGFLECFADADEVEQPPEPEVAGAEGDDGVRQVAHAIESELKRVPGTRDVYTIGGAQNIVHVELDPQLVAGFGMTLEELRFALTSTNAVTHAGSIVSSNVEIPVQAGTFLATPEDVRSLDVALFGAGAGRRGPGPGLLDSDLGR